MTKPRPISSVHVDIARLAWEVSNISKDSPEDLGAWTLRLVECLVKRDPAIHAYGAHLLAEVDEFRKADSDRKRAKYSVDSVDSVDSPESPPRSDQIRSDQINKEEKKSKSKSKREPLPRFQPPTLQEVSDYCRERGTGIDPEKFYAYYESNGWKVGRNPMKSWKAAITTWEKGSQNGTDRKHNAGFESTAQRNQRKLLANLGIGKPEGDHPPADNCVLFGNAPRTAGAGFP